MRAAALACLALLCLAALACAAGPRVTRVEKAAFAASLSRAGETITVAVEARGGFHLNADYPLHFRFDDGRRVERAAFTFAACPGHPDEQCRAEAAIPLAGAAPRGTLAFSVCDPNQCLIEKVPLAAR